MLLLYAKVSRVGTLSPSTDPMMITLAGFVGFSEAASSRGVRSWVMVKTRWRFSVRTRVHAASGYSEYGAPQFDPELLIRTSSSVTSWVIQLAIV